jgi:hypothetical protein
MPSRNPEENISAQSVKLGSCCWSVPISIHWSFFLLLGIHIIMAFFYGFDFVMYALIFYGPIHFLTVLVVSLKSALILDRKNTCFMFVFSHVGFFFLNVSMKLHMPLSHAN